MSIFSEHLKHLRTERGLTQQELSDLLGLGGKKQIVYNYENEKSEPDFKTLTKMADIFKCTIDYLLGKSDYPTHEHELHSNESILSQEAINKILELDPDLQTFLLNNLMNNDKFYDLITILHHCITFPYETLKDWEGTYTKATNNIPEEDYSMLKKRWLQTYIDDKAGQLFDDLIKNGGEN